MHWKQFGIGTIAVTVTISSVFAADLDRGGTQCVTDYRSPILDLALQQEISVELNRRYDEALSTSEDPQVISSRRQIYNWAIEAKVSCAKAIGFLKYSEINEYQIDQCDCYYGRMYMLSH
jgi:hypothetical protein